MSRLSVPAAKAQDRRTVVQETLIPHTAFRMASDRIERSFKYVNGKTPPLHTVIIGESRAGKSTVLEEAESRHPPYRTSEGRVVPIIRVKADAKPSPKALAERMLFALGDPRFYSGTENIKTMRLEKLILEAGVKMLMIDEFQHFYDERSSRVVHHVADWLKRIADDTKVALVVAGLPTCRAVIAQNEQLKGRFMAPITLRRFDWKSENDREEFLGILASFHESLAEHFSIPALAAPEMQFRCYCACGGLIGLLAKYLQKTVEDADDEERSTITLADLARATNEAIWQAEKLPGLVNPFSREFTHSPLPALLERIAQIGAKEPESPRRRNRGVLDRTQESLNQILTARRRTGRSPKR